MRPLGLILRMRVWRVIKFNIASRGHRFMERTFQFSCMLLDDIDRGMHYAYRINYYQRQKGLNNVNTLFSFRLHPNGSFNLKSSYDVVMWIAQTNSSEYLALIIYFSWNCKYNPYYNYINISTDKSNEQRLVRLKPRTRDLKCFDTSFLLSG